MANPMRMALWYGPKKPGPAGIMMPMTKTHTTVKPAVTGKSQPNDCMSQYMPMALAAQYSSVQKMTVKPARMSGSERRPVTNASSMSMTLAVRVGEMGLPMRRSRRGTAPVGQQRGDDDGGSTGENAQRDEGARAQGRRDDVRRPQIVRGEKNSKVTSRPSSARSTTTAPMPADSGAPTSFFNR